jgi:hypothetical protein
MTTLTSPNLGGVSTGREQRTPGLFGAGVAAPVTVSAEIQNLLVGPLAGTDKIARLTDIPPVAELAAKGLLAEDVTSTLNFASQYNWHKKLALKKGKTLTVYGVINFTGVALSDLMPTSDGSAAPLVTGLPAHLTNGVFNLGTFSYVSPGLTYVSGQQVNIINYSSSLVAVCGKIATVRPDYLSFIIELELA